MFDTGAHMMNTVCLLTDADCELVSALMNNRERSVDVVCAIPHDYDEAALVDGYQKGSQKGVLQPKRGQDLKAEILGSMR